MTVSCRHWCKLVKRLFSRTSNRVHKVLERKGSRLGGSLSDILGLYVWSSRFGRFAQWSIVLADS